MRIRYKLILAIGVPLLILLTLMVVSDFVALRRAAAEQVSSRLEEVAERYATAFDGQFRAVAAVARATAAMVEADQDLTERELYTLLRGNVESDPLVFGSATAFVPGWFPDQYRSPAEELNLPPAPGTATREPGRLFGPYVFRGGENRALARLDLATRYDYTQSPQDWFTRPMATAQPGWSEPYFDTGAGNVPMVTYSHPIRRGATLAGVVTVDVSLADLRQLTLTNTPPGVEVFMFSRRGVLVLAADAQAVMTYTLDHAAEEVTGPGAEELVHRIRRGEAGVSRVIGLADGKPYLAFVARVPSTGWMFGGATPEAEAMASVYRLLATRVIVGLGTIAVIIVVVLGLGVWIVSPIRRLADAVRGLSVAALTGEAGRLPRDVRISRDEVGDLSRAFEGMVRQLRDQLQQLTTETRAREAVESELRLARSIQVSLLPTQFVDRRDLALHALSVPARFVGGDFFDFLFLPDGSLVFVVADVSGKGVPAAMLMAVTRTILRDLVTTECGPGEALTRANRLLMDNNPESMFVTVALARYDPRTGQLRLANAGHPPPIVLARDGTCRPVGTSTGTVLGVVEDQRVGEITATLAPGERLVLYTDGVSEAKAPDGTMFTDDGLKEAMTRLRDQPPQAFCDALFAELETFQAGTLHDDITLLVLDRR